MSERRQRREARRRIGRSRFRGRRRRWRPFPRPREGRRLRAELRARHVGQLAETLHAGLNDPGFETLLRRIDQAPIHARHRVDLFFRGEAAFDAMLAAIDGATREVLVEAYILKDDATGEDLRQRLAAAVGRGVSVCVLADAFGSAATRSSFWQTMEQQGIELRLFNRPFAYLWYEPFRDHRKILVVDRQVAFTGGMNIGSEYRIARSAQEPAWRDTHVRVEGPTAWEMAVVFAEGWFRAGGRPLELEPLTPTRGEGARILVLDSRPGRGHAESASVLAAIVGAAREQVWITNAYFAPLPVTVSVLARAAERGVDVRLLLPGRTDVPIVRHAGHGYFDELLQRGVRIFEYQPTILHAKTLVADGVVSVVGSSNLDFRSFRFNAECNLVILDEPAGREMTDAFSEDLRQSCEITPSTWRRRLWLHRAGDRVARLLSPLL
ncbi:MAG: cardiolipin synthase B [Acidobacteriota bacterium]|nr:MAG: cardiolipin synthase B [Acidobacteriota bacterium]